MDFSNIAFDSMTDFDATDICNGWCGASGCLSDTGSDVAVFRVDGDDADLDRFSY